MKNLVAGTWSEEPGLNLVEQAMGAAQAAFLARKSDAQRADLLDAIASQIETLGDELISVCHKESNLPIPRLTGERGRTCNQLRGFANLLREGKVFQVVEDPADPDRQPAPKPDLKRILIPIGPVVVFGASNFPLAFSVAGGDTASALAAGCPVVVKAHPFHPETCNLVAGAIQKALEQTGFEPGWFSMLHGEHDLGQALVLHEFTAGVGFTGSYRGGKALFDLANSRPNPIPVFAEMGSTNPVFILENALKDRGASIAKGLAGSVALGVGQFCTNPGVVFVQSGPQAEEFIAQLKLELSSQLGGTMLSSSICRSYWAGLQTLSDNATGVLVPNQPDEQMGAPALFRCTYEDYLANEALREEVFGPVTLVVEVSSETPLVNVAAKLAGQLTGSIHFDEADAQAAKKLAFALRNRVGRIVVNGFPTGVELGPAMQHGGPFPATTDSRFTSVGLTAIDRWLRPVCLQDAPDDWI